MIVRDCRPDALEVVSKAEAARKPPAAERPRPDYIYLLPSERRPAGICFENLTYNGAAPGAGAVPHRALPPGPWGLRAAAPGHRLRSPQPGYVNSPAETPAGEVTLNYVSQVASPPSGHKDGPPAKPLELAPRSEYRMQMAVPPDLASPSPDEDGHLSSLSLSGAGDR